MKGKEELLRMWRREIWGRRRRELGNRGVSVIKASKYNVFSSKEIH